MLALDLSTPQGVLVLDGPGGTSSRDIAGDTRVSHLFVAAGEVMSDAGISARELGLVGVARGPGSFTGVRVAVTAAKVLAAVLNTPLVAPDSLMVTAAAAGGGKDAVFAALDARRGEVYHALFRIVDGYPASLLAPCVSPPREAAASLLAWMEREDAGVTGIGDGIQAYPGAWPAGMTMNEVATPQPAGLANLCRLAASRGESIAPVELLPLYLRHPNTHGGGGRGKGGQPC